MKGIDIVYRNIVLKDNWLVVGCRFEIIKNNINAVSCDVYSNELILAIKRRYNAIQGSNIYVNSGENGYVFDDSEKEAVTIYNRCDFVSQLQKVIK